MLAHEGLLIASPEYNSSITPLLKNTIDWVSLAGDGEKALAGYEGNVAAVMSTSPGRLGGLRGLVHLRSILSNIGVLVIPDQAAVGVAHAAFDEDGDLVDEGRRASIRGLGQSVTKLLHWNRCPEGLAAGSAAPTAGRSKRQVRVRARTSSRFGASRRPAGQA